jgi:hypothetical protein
MEQAEERLEHALPLTALALKTGSSPSPREGSDLGVGAHAVEIALVELDDEGQLLEADTPSSFRFCAQVEERGGVVLGLARSASRR